jgi:hypothetical protein
MRLSARVVSVFLLFSFVFVMAIPAQSPQGNAGASAAQTYSGYEVSVLSLERMKKWSAGGKAFEPKDQNQEFVVLRIHVRPLEHQKDFSLTRDAAGVRDADGKTYAMPLNKYGVVVVEQGTLMELPFAVPVGTRLLSLHLGNVSFDLTQTKEVKPKPTQ